MAKIKTNPYKTIKKAVDDIEGFHRDVKPTMFLVTSFDKDFNIFYDVNAVGKYLSFIKETFKGMQPRYFFTYNEWKRYDCPKMPTKYTVICYSDEQAKDVAERHTTAQREKVKIVRNDTYELVDRRCNLDLSLDLMKISAKSKGITVAFFEPEKINKTFFFFHNVFVLRHTKTSAVCVGDNVIISRKEEDKIVKTKFVETVSEKIKVGNETEYRTESGVYALDDMERIMFPIDKYARFHQQKSEMEIDDNNIIQIYKKGI